VPGSSASPRQIAITVADDNTFSPNLVTVAQGETVAFTVRNVGVKEHGFAVGSVADVFATPTTARATATVAGGASATVTFEVTGAGPFAFASTADGDVAAGVVGYLVVVGPDVPATGTDAAPRLIALTAQATGLDVKTVEVAKGETVTFLVSNAGFDAREFIVGPRDNVATAAIDQITTVTTGPIAPGQIKPLTYTFPAAGGTFTYATHLAGAPQVEPPGTITFR
jgi:uncharacterized cupredoxin-like copper-binding protein